MAPESESGDLSNGRHGVELARTDSIANGEHTPTTEAPAGISLNVVTPNTSHGSSSDSSHDYFAFLPQLEPIKTSETPSYRPPRSPRQHPTSAPSQATATGHMLLPQSAAGLHPLQLQQGSLRPQHPARDFSSNSTVSGESHDSNTTITAEKIAHLEGLTQSQGQRPAYPNQSYAALHQQYYHPPHQPPILRQRSSHPAQILTFSAALASQHQSGVRTQGNSPAATPTGLFANGLPPTRQELEDKYNGTYASPYLNSFQRQPPTTSHFADVDVDPITGRKLINHYEIIDELGRGTHGKVKLGRDLQNDKHVAIKIVERYSKRRKLGKLVENPEDKVKKEVAILKKARHPNVVGLLEVIDDPSRKKVYIVLEWVERGEIQWRVKAPKEIAIVEARRYEIERQELFSPKTQSEQVAVEDEARRRLKRQKRRQIRSFKRMRRGASDGPEIWSIEVGGDGGSDTSDDDQLSRISTATADSQPGALKPPEGRRGSRAPSPFIPSSTSVLDTQTQYIPLTSEPPTTSPVTAIPEDSVAESIASVQDAGTQGQYGANSAHSSRVPSLAGSSVPSLSSDGLKKNSSDEMHNFLHEVFDQEINSELQYVPCMSQSNVRKAFRDTLLGLQYLHYQGIVHRDIKPPNLLQSLDRRVKISDFGVSYLGRPLHEGDHGEDVSESEARDLEGDEAKELAKTVGTPAFYAPELCITEAVADPPPITKAIDVWALGITLFCMLYARTPFVDSEFVVMRQIAEEDIYIPRRRLQPVDLKPKSRPTSHGRAFPALPMGRRHELDLMYEDVGDDLFDLMKRLLEKDPRKRITLEEVRHHPWVTADIHDKLAWIEETDPLRQSQGKKIKVSNEDMNTAVVPLQFLDRVRSGLKTVTNKVGESLFGRSRTRGRAQSTASGNGVSPTPSAASSSSTISQDGRRQSLRGDESIYNALQRSREPGEHPLSRSVAASPDTERSTESLPSTEFPRNGTAKTGHQRTPSRPLPPERSKTMMSTAASVRTIRQSDFRNVADSPPPSPGLPGTPVALDSNAGHGLGGLLGGASRRIYKSFRERSVARSADPRDHSIDRYGSQESLDPHGGPSLAVSRAIAAGSVNQPEALRDMTPASSAQNSPAGSRPHSVVNSPERLCPPHREGGLLSHKSSISSLASNSRLRTASSTPESKSPMRRVSNYQIPESSAEDWARADDERVRRLVQESKDESTSRPSSRPTSAWDDRHCPPSPDDHRVQRPNDRAISEVDINASDSVSPTDQRSAEQSPPARIQPVSSASDYGSGVSMSFSNPSIPSVPSVISEPSSIDPNEEGAGEALDADDKAQNRQMFVGDKPVNAPQIFGDDSHDDVYTADESETALDSENEEEEYESSSDDSDGGLTMRRRRSATKQKGLNFGSNGGLSAALEAQTNRMRRGTGLSVLSGKSNKSSRSGSNNTMKKIITREGSDEQQLPNNSLEVPEH